MSRVERLLDLMAKLRDPQDGCPWDLEQDFASVAPYTIEEAYEVDDAIRRQDFDALRDELGDLLLQVVFHAQMAREGGRFGFDDVVDAICDKLWRRHPHVFGDAQVESAGEQSEAWERLKAQERAGRGEMSVLDGVPAGMPALLRARKLLGRAARAGFAWPDPEAAAGKLDEEILELRQELRAGDPARQHAELGDVLLAAAALARSLDLDPESALRDATARFEVRLRQLESRLGAEGRSLSDVDGSELLERWSRAKRAG